MAGANRSEQLITLPVMPPSQTGQRVLGRIKTKLARGTAKGGVSQNSDGSRFVTPTFKHQQGREPKTITTDNKGARTHCVEAAVVTSWSSFVSSGY